MAGSKEWEGTDPRYRFNHAAGPIFGPGVRWTSLPCEFYDRPTGLHGYCMASRQWLAPVESDDLPSDRRAGLR